MAETGATTKPTGARLPAMGRGARRRIVAIALLSAATLALFASPVRFATTETGILPNLDFAQGLAGWRRSNGAVLVDPATGVASILATPGRPPGVLLRVLARPHRFSHIRVALDARAENVVAGAEPWRIAGVRLRGARAGRWLDPYWPSEVARLEGDTPWRRFEAVIPVQPGAETLRLILYNAGVSGVLSVRDLALDALAERPLARIARWLLAFLWILGAAWAVAPAIARARKRPAGLATIATGALILGLVLTPQPELSNTIAALSTDADRAIAWAEAGAGENPAPARANADRGAAETARPSNDRGNDRGDDRTRAQNAAPTSAFRTPAPRAARGPVRASVGRLARTTIAGLGPQDVGHFLAFTLLAFLAFGAFPEVARRHLLVYLATGALASEVAQSFLVTRTTQLSDAALDTGGVVIGWLAFIAWRRARRGPARLASLE